jgi:ATP-dependent helicase HrpB
MTVQIDLPVAEILGHLDVALDAQGSAVLVAPPGAGKTTLVPLHLLNAAWRGDGRILLLEPRRIAARAAARRMAALLGEEVGETVGYAMRMDNRQSAATRILVVTEGVLARMILDDAELPGIAAIVFDEFHERSLDGDFGLALALDVQEALRPDLRLLVMSATLDGARVASLLGEARVIESKGRSFPVTVTYRERAAGTPIEDAMAEAVRHTLSSETGSILCFLPGQREIERTAERLEGRVGEAVDLVPLYGNLDARAQDAAIRPAPAGRRKVVLATSIAETSITIDGVRVVIDSGLSRQPRFEPASGLTRLETVRASRASADQRAGRAGRTEPGIAIRLWREQQTAALPAFDPPEIKDADLSGLLLDCAAFGVADPSTLRFLDAPPAPALAEARSLLEALGALDADGRLTSEGAAMRRLALPARLAHMVAKAGKHGSQRLAAEIAILLTERGLGGRQVDISRRLDGLRRERGARAEAARNAARRMAAQVDAPAAAGEPLGIGACLAAAYPDRIAKARGGRGRYVLANGRGAMLDEADPLAGEPFLVIADLQGAPPNARISAAAAIDEAEMRDLLSARIETLRSARFDLATRSVRQEEVTRLGAIVLATRNLPPRRGPDADAAMIEAVRAGGISILPWDKAASTFRDRLAWLHRGLGEPWPDMGDDALAHRLDEWLAPFLTGSPSLDAITSGTLREGLRALVPHDLARQIDRLAPTHYDAPSGSTLPIRYEGEAPVLAIRVQELFGLDRHPAIANGSVPLTLELLSPAHRPIQTTRDLPGFWRGSWADVRADMRGRYPKHHWPENPLEAQATNRAKPRKGA